MKIRRDIVHTYQSIHTWTGITTGLLLFICFFAGALTMFKQPLQRWAVPQSSPLPVLAQEKMDVLIQQAMASSAQAARGFDLHLNNIPAALSWTDAGEDTLLGRETLTYASLDQQGGLLTNSVAAVHIAALLDELHRTAGIPGMAGNESLGVLVMGLVSVVYFLALVSGLIFLLPTLVRSFLALRDRKGPFRWLLDTHNLVGITSLPFHIIIAVTAVVFAFHDLFYDGLGLIYADQPLFPRAAPGNNSTATQLQPLAAYLQQAASLLPGHQVDMLSFRDLQGARPVVQIFASSNEQLQINPLGNMLILNPYSLDLIYTTWPLGQEGIWGRLVNSFFALHFGSFGGNWVLWMYFLLGMGGAYLFYSGNLLWISKRRQQKHYPRQRLDSVAALTYGVVYGCMAGIAAALLAGRWLTPWTDEPNLLCLGSYYLVFITLLVSAFRLGGEAARTPLLRLTATLYLLLPLSRAGDALLNAQWPLWPTLDSLLTDIALLSFAIVLAYRARRPAEADQHAALPAQQS